MNSLDSLSHNKYVILFVPINRYINDTNKTIKYEAITGMKTQTKGYVDLYDNSIRVKYGQPIGWLDLPTDHDW